MKKYILSVLFFFSIVQKDMARAGDYICSTVNDVYEALKEIRPGETIILDGGKVYQINKSFKLKASGKKNRRITFTSKDRSGKGRYAVISTVGGKKEDMMTAISVRGSYWNISKIEITGKRKPTKKGYWDTHGFRIGLYLKGASYNIIEDIHVHDTHNTGIAVRAESNYNTFRRINVHHTGDWLNEKHDAHVGEGIYVGSSASFEEAGKKAIVNHLVIEDSVFGPGTVGQFVDLKYATSFCDVRNNIFYCNEKIYGKEIIKVSGHDNVVRGNKFIGHSKNILHYIDIVDKGEKKAKMNKKIGKHNKNAADTYSTKKKNIIMNNICFTDNSKVLIVKTKKTSALAYNNIIGPFDKTSAKSQESPKATVIIKRNPNSIYSRNVQVLESAPKIPSQ